MTNAHRKAAQDRLLSTASATGGIAAAGGIGGAPHRLTAIGSNGFGTATANASSSGAQMLNLVGGQSTVALNGGSSTAESMVLAIGQSPASFSLGSSLHKATALGTGCAQASPRMSTLPGPATPMFSRPSTRPTAYRASPFFSGRDATGGINFATRLQVRGMTFTLTRFTGRIRRFTRRPCSIRR